MSCRTVTVTGGQSATSFAEVTIQSASGGENQATATWKYRNTHDSLKVDAIIEDHDGNKLFRATLDPGQSITKTAQWNYDVSSATQKQVCVRVRTAQFAG